MSGAGQGAVPSVVPSQVVAGTKELVSSTVSGAVGLARGAVQGGVERTRSVLSTGVSTVVGSRVGRLLATGVDTVLGKSEELVERYLPGTDEELGECRPQKPSPRFGGAEPPTPLLGTVTVPLLSPPQQRLGCSTPGQPMATATLHRGRSPAGECGVVVGELSPGNQKANIAPRAARPGIYSSARGGGEQSWPRVTAEVTGEAT